MYSFLIVTSNTPIDCADELADLNLSCAQNVHFLSLRFMHVYCLRRHYVTVVACEVRNKD